MSEWTAEAARERLVPEHGPHSFPENKAHCTYCQTAEVFDRLTAAEQRAGELESALEQIADGDMPVEWHPGNIAWWLRGIARKALGREEWGFQKAVTPATGGAQQGGRE